MMRRPRHAADESAAWRPDEWSYRSAICSYVIAEASDGVKREQLAQMAFGGRPAEEEAEHLDEALSHLRREGHVRMCGEVVLPAGAEEPEAAR